MAAPHPAGGDPRLAAPPANPRRAATGPPAGPAAAGPIPPPRSLLLHLAVLVLCGGAAAQPLPGWHEDVLVTAGRLPLGAAPARRVLVLERDDIAALPVHSVAELVALLAGSGIVGRGTPGAQADGQLRGSTFEQLAVLVNGVRMNDPQTGHFHLDLPIPLDAIERIEVLLGPGSAVHGPDAFGGVIAITTAPPRRGTLRLGAGQHALAQASATAPLGAGLWVSGERRTTAGFRDGTELSATRGSLQWHTRLGDWQLAADLAADSKKFGALAFYSTRYPNQREETATSLLTTSLERQFSAARLEIRLGARQHRDFYLLDRARPDWYANRHRSRSGLLQAFLSASQGAWAWSCGLEGERQLLASSRLGDHQRSRAALFGEGSWQHRRLHLAGQVRLDSPSTVGRQFSPGFSLALDLGRGVTLSAHRARSFRLPSFTELYYDSPTSVGNPDLEPEVAWSDEALIRGSAGSLRWEFAAFRRRAEELIDFVRGDDDVWRARNYPRLLTRGVEASLELGQRGALRSARLSLSRLHSELEADPARSRYALAHPRFEAGLLASFSLSLALEVHTSFRWRQPQAGGSYALADLRLTRELGPRLELAVEANNVLDRQYQEVPGVPMPGRWLAAQLVWRP